MYDDCMTMSRQDLRISDPQIVEWLGTKKNESATIREAVKMLYQKELQDNFTKQEVKPTLRAL